MGRGPEAKEERRDSGAPLAKDGRREEGCEASANDGLRAVGSEGIAGKAND
jgi:hypothetical protein